MSFGGDSKGNRVFQQIKQIKKIREKPWKSHIKGLHVGSVKYHRDFYCAITLTVLIYFYF